MQLSTEKHQESMKNHKDFINNLGGEGGKPSRRSSPMNCFPEMGVIGLEFNSQILRKLKHLHLRLNFTPASQNCRIRTAASKLSGSAS